MKQTVGLLAHVDAGKTTLSEQLLYRTGTIRTLGRVDHHCAYLDSDDMEKRRGITIFSGEAPCSWQGVDFELVDTPGHADFVSETERALEILDCAILIVSAAEGVQAHTETLWRMLKEKNIPTLLFLNKTDRAGADAALAAEALKRRFGAGFFWMQGAKEDEPLPNEAAEEAAQSDDGLLWDYLNGRAADERLKEALTVRFYRREVFPLFYGSALRGEGIDELLCGLCLLLLRAPSREETSFRAKAYKVRHDKDGRRLTFLKILSGTLRA